MRTFFDTDGPLMRALSQLADIVILNLLTLLCCVPVVTAGGAFAAMHYVIIRMHEGTEGSVVRLFFREFKANLKKAGASWLMILAVCFILYVDDYVVKTYMAGNTGIWRGFIYAAAVLLCAWTMYVFPLHARFENTIPGTWKNASILMLAFLPRTLAMMAIEAVILFVVTQVAALMPLFIVFGLTLPAFLRAYLYLPVFARIKNTDAPEEAEGAEAEDGAEETDEAEAEDGADR